RDLEPGKYHLTARKRGFGPAEYGARALGHPGTTISLDPGQHLRDIVVRLSPQAVVTGRVVDEDGDPVPQAQVSLLKYAYSRGKRQLEPRNNAGTNDLGEYRMYGLPPGRYYLSALPTMEFQNRITGGPAYAATYYPASSDPGGGVMIELQPGTLLRGIDITLLKTRTVDVRGRVVHAGTGGPAQGVQVMLDTTDPHRQFTESSAMSDSQGAFEIRGVVPGSYALLALGTQGTKPYVGRQAIDLKESNVENVILEM